MDGCEPHHLGQVCPLKGDLEVLGPSVLEAHLALGLSPRVDLNASPIPVSAREGGAQVKTGLHSRLLVEEKTWALSLW